VVGRCGIFGSLGWGIQRACSGVRPATAVLTGTNHSALLWVERSCSRRMERRLAGLSWGLGWVWAMARGARRRVRRNRLRDMRAPFCDRVGWVLRARSKGIRGEVEWVEGWDEMREGGFLRVA